MAADSRGAPVTAVSLATAGPGQSAPILSGSNPLGDTLVSSRVMSFAGTRAGAMVPVLPVHVIGFNVREQLHRFLAEAQVPTIDAGVTAVNALGEPLAGVTMNLLVAPDGFDATTSLRPPATELDDTRSQRLVMHDAVLRFRDRSQSGARFFGAGRTFPVIAAGRRRLLFAGAGIVVEGLGNLRGLRGAVTIAGEIAARSVASLVVTGRFDDDGPFEQAIVLQPILPHAGAGPDGAVMIFAGLPRGTAPGGETLEALAVASIDNDVPHGVRPRSAFRAGERVGGVTGDLQVDASDKRCAVPLPASRRDFVFMDADGRMVANALADALEGTALPDLHDAQGTTRVVGYSLFSSCTGALEDSAGLMTFDIAQSGQASSSLYTLWLTDSARRLRVPLTVPAALEHSEMPSVHQFAFVEASAPSVIASDLDVIGRVDAALARARDLHAWFAAKDQIGFSERFNAGSAELGAERFGFFDAGPAGSAVVPVMGAVCDAAFDRAAGTSLEGLAAQLKEFVLGYFLRACRMQERDGFQQLYYKLAATGQIGKFAKAERRAIVDARGIGPKYAWVALSTDMISLSLPFAPLGDRFAMSMPVDEARHVAIDPAFIVNRDNPRPGVLGEYGVGYALVAGTTPRPDDTRTEAPHRTAVQTVRFTILADGEIRTKTAFVTSRPAAFASVDVDPIGWGVRLADAATFRTASRMMSPLLSIADRLPLRARGVDLISAYIDVANKVTGGLAARDFGISRDAVERRMLLEHVKQQREMLLESLHVWRTVPDWTTPGSLPAYSVAGKIW